MTKITNTPEEVEESYLSKICKEVRNILKAHDYMIATCKDTVKNEAEFILFEPLEINQLSRNYTCSVYHTTHEKAINTNQINSHLSSMEGVIYIDCHRKVNKKNGLIPVDEIDKFARTVLNILYNNPSFNGSCDAWEFKGKQLWEVNVSTKENTDKMQPNILMDYINQIVITVYYSHNYHNYYDA